LEFLSWVTKFFKREALPLREAEHPTFGKMQYHAYSATTGSWATNESVKTKLADQPIDVFIDASPTDPVTCGDQAFDELVQRLPAMRQQIKLALAQGLNEFLDFFSATDPRRKEFEILKTDVPERFLQLSSITLGNESDPGYELSYSFRDEYPSWDDGALVIFIDAAWNVCANGWND
jgi:hypothetical protein